MHIAESCEFFATICNLYATIFHVLQGTSIHHNLGAKLKAGRLVLPCLLASLQPQLCDLPPVLVPDVPVIHNAGSLIIITAIIRQARVHLYVRHRNMKEVDIHPSTCVEPDFHK